MIYVIEKGLKNLLRKNKTKQNKRNMQRIEGLPLGCQKREWED